MAFLSLGHGVVSCANRSAGKLRQPQTVELVLGFTCSSHFHNAVPCVSSAAGGGQSSGYLSAADWGTRLAFT
jgi:hypothetical protein